MQTSLKITRVELIASGGIIPQIARKSLDGDPPRWIEWHLEYLAHLGFVLPSSPQRLYLEETSGRHRFPCRPSLIFLENPISSKTRESALGIFVVATVSESIRITLDDGWVMMDGVRRTTASGAGANSEISLLEVENQPSCL